MDKMLMLSLLVAFIFLVGILIGSELGSRNIQKQAIDRNIALFCPTTGNFGWQGECGK